MPTAKAETATVIAKMPTAKADCRIARARDDCDRIARAEMKEGKTEIDREEVAESLKALIPCEKL